MSHPADCIGFIGGGNMATAIGEGIIKKGVLKASEVWVSGPHIEHLHYWKTLGVNVTDRNGLVVAKCDVIFISVKPYMLQQAIKDCVDTQTDGDKISEKLFISILAGTSLEVLKSNLLHFPKCRIIRVMPNTPMLVGQGASVYTPDTQATEKDCALVEKILGSCGIFQRIPESMINAAGGLSGSGPAFVYLMIEALSDGGVKQGLSREMATTFAAQTVLGAAQMVLSTGRHPGQLKDEVCSPGGSTICGVHQLEVGGVRASYISAVQAAVERTKEMAKLHEI